MLSLNIYFLSLEDNCLKFNRTAMNIQELYATETVDFNNTQPRSERVKCEVIFARTLASKIYTHLCDLYIVVNFNVGTIYISSLGGSMSLICVRRVSQGEGFGQVEE